MQALDRYWTAGFFTQLALNRSDEWFLPPGAAAGQAPGPGAAAVADQQNLTTTHDQRPHADLSWPGDTALHTAYQEGAAVGRAQQVLRQCSRLN